MYQKSRDQIEFFIAGKHQSFLPVSAIAFLVGMASLTWSTKNNKLAISLLNMIFYMKINIRIFYKLVVLFLLVIASHAQSTRNSKFVISLQYLKKEGRDKVDFLHADNYVWSDNYPTIWYY